MFSDDCLLLKASISMRLIVFATVFDIKMDFFFWGFFHHYRYCPRNYWINKSLFYQHFYVVAGIGG